MKNAESLTEISRNIAAILGLDFQAHQLHDLERGLKNAAKELEIEVSISGIKDWLSKPSFTNIELKTLAAHLTIGETYFFREKSGLELFKHEIIPQIIRQRDGKDEQIRIWCAGCSSGEEPYSIAMILKEYFPELTNWNITILATDISPLAIQKALQGEYTQWSFRETESFLKNKYFTPVGKNWCIRPEIKKMVTFSYLNLCQNSYPSSLTNTTEMDVVFCRNVLMYFTPGVIHEVSHRLYNSLITDGWLITSQVELNDEYFSAFERVQYKQYIFYRKTDKPKEPLTVHINNYVQDLPLKNNHKRDIKKDEIKKPVKQLTDKNLQPVVSPGIAFMSSENLDSLYRQGQYLKCIESCRQMIANGKLNNVIFEFLVKSYANAGMLRDGETIINKIISDNLTTPEMYYIYASFLSEQHEEEQAEMMLNKAIYLNHKHILAHLMLGELLVKRDKRHLAIKHYEIVIELLGNYEDFEMVPESDGSTAGGIKALASIMIKKL